MPMQVAAEAEARLRSDVGRLAAQLTEGEGELLLVQEERDAAKAAVRLRPHCALSGASMGPGLRSGCGCGMAGGQGVWAPDASLA